MCILDPAQASEIAATVGQAFQLAYNRFEDAKAAQLGVKDMKDKASVFSSVFPLNTLCVPCDS